MNFNVASRKSELALAQTRLVIEALQKKCIDSFEICSMTTEGDRRLDKRLNEFGGKGVFIKELEVALLEKRADFAVHSLKDMPAEVLNSFEIATVLKREDPRDVFIGKKLAFKELPAGAKIGTGSIRRIVQLKKLRSDLEYVPIRGNLQTRLKKLDELDGIVLAAAGIKRLGLSNYITEIFSPDEILPAAGQGIIAIEILKNAPIKNLLLTIDDLHSHLIAIAEMAFLKALNAGCQFPIAAFAEITGETLKIRGFYFEETKNIDLKMTEECVLNFNNSRDDLFIQAKNAGIQLAEKFIQTARISI